MRVHFIDTTNLVVNTVEQGDLSCPFHGQTAVSATATSDIGDTYVSPGVFTKPPPPPPSLDDFKAAIQAHLDAEAQTHGYDGILSACSYASSTDATFAAEGQACVAWRDTCWRYGYDQLQLVETGQRPPPATTAAFVAELPTMVWPT